MRIMKDDLFAHQIHEASAGAQRTNHYINSMCNINSSCFALTVAYSLGHLSTSFCFAALKLTLISIKLLNLEPGPDLCTG